MSRIKRKAVLSGVWAQIAMIGFLSVASGGLVNWWRPLSLPWVFNPEAAAARPDDTSGRVEVDAAYLLESLARNNVTIIDARPEVFYRFGHIPGAVNVPPERLEQALAELPPAAVPSDREIIVYCSDRFCSMAENLIVKLATAGHRSAKLFSPGYAGWEAAGHKIEVIHD